MILMLEALQPPPEPTHITLLAQAQAALGRGEVDYSQALSKSALLHAQRQHDANGQARALLYLAQGDRQLSHLRRARETAERAIHMFQAQGDEAGEAEALTTLANILSLMGHSGDGLEAALLALKLSEARNPVAEAYACNYLGVAYACSQSFDNAAYALGRSVRMFEAQSLWAESCLPRYHLRYAEMHRCFMDRYYHGAVLSLDRLAQVPLLPESVPSRSGAVRSMLCPNRKMRALLDLTHAFELCWRGEVVQASQKADLVSATVAQGMRQPAVILLEMWLRAEISWAQENWMSAEAHAQRFLQTAIRTENEHLRATAYLLLSQIYAAQGKDAPAQAQLRLLKMREVHLRSEALHEHEQRVEWQLRVRADRQASHMLALKTRQLERLAMQDPLTGLYNRRYLEEQVPGVLQEALERQRTPALVFVDVDQFKQINDRYSHRVGDSVLQALGRILSGFVREGDVSVRLGGDEFVVLFSHVDVASSQALVARIHKAVNDYDWDSVHPGLAVRASAGLALAESGDTLSSWLHRCDLQMYVEKDSRYQDLA
jgi:diguanylate cyclase (GGDEF)-like protein